MTEFTLDTSGVIYGDHDWLTPDGTRWSDLSPFAQGYVGAMFASLRRGDLGYLPLGMLRKELAFANLAPETLALILRDCEALAAKVSSPDYDSRNSRTMGEGCWQERSRDNRIYRELGFPPLTPYLGDDGKVYLREGA